MNMSTQTKLFRGCILRLGNGTVDFVVQIVPLEALEARFPSLAQAFRLEVIQYDTAFQWGGQSAPALTLSFLTGMVGQQTVAAVLVHV